MSHLKSPTKVTNVTNVTNVTKGQRVAGLELSRWAQRALAAAAALALVGLLVAIALQIAATQPGSKPAKVVGVRAGPYPLDVSLYRDPADAGYALPLALAPAQPVQGPLTYTVMSVPGPGVDATAVNASLGADPRTVNGVVGAVEITVQGPWFLRIQVDGPGGSGIASVPITAKPAVVIPTWIAWPIGLIPAIGLTLFFIAQRTRTDDLAQAPVAAPAAGAGVGRDGAQESG
jgi:hypothetical protein